MPSHITHWSKLQIWLRTINSNNLSITQIILKSVLQMTINSLSKWLSNAGDQATTEGHHRGHRSYKPLQRSVFYYIRQIANNSQMVPTCCIPGSQNIPLSKEFIVFN